MSVVMEQAPVLQLNKNIKQIRPIGEGQYATVVHGGRVQIGGSESINQLDLGRQRVSAMETTTDGSILLGTSTGSLLSYHNQEIVTIAEFGNRVNNLSRNTNGEIVGAASLDAFVINEGQVERFRNPHGREVKQTLAYEGSRRLLIADATGGGRTESSNITIYDRNTGEVVFTEVDYTPTTAITVAGNHLVMGFNGGGVLHVINLEEQQMKRRDYPGLYEPHTLDPAHRITTVSPYGTDLLAADSQGNLRVLDLDDTSPSFMSPKEGIAFMQHDAAITTANVFESEGVKLIVSTDKAGIVCVWDNAGSKVSEYSLSSEVTALSTSELGESGRLLLHVGTSAGDLYDIELNPSGELQL